MQLAFLLIIMNYISLLPKHNTKDVLKSITIYSELNLSLTDTVANSHHFLCLDLPSLLMNYHPITDSFLSAFPAYH